MESTANWQKQPGTVAATHGLGGVQSCILCGPGDFTRDFLWARISLRPSPPPLWCSEAFPQPCDRAVLREHHCLPWLHTAPALVPQPGLRMKRGKCLHAREERHQELTQAPHHEASWLPQLSAAGGNLRHRTHYLLWASDKRSRCARSAPLTYFPAKAIGNYGKIKR